MAKTGKTKKEQVAEAVAQAVGAGREVSVETVDFSDPNRPKTCLEVDFPILPINQIAAIEGNAGKPIYQMSKWWARRRSSVFRSLLIAAAMKAPDDPAEAAKAVWDVYYANHQAKGNFTDLKVADIFMGGGTTIVEGSRLGMQMFGCDLNPVAWFVVKNELAQVDIEEVKALLADIEAEVKPQIMPFYTCDCPRGHKGKWTELSTGKILGEQFDPLRLTPDQRKDYCYEGPEIIYVFWAKHGPCQVTGCGHRTPIMSSPVMAIKSLTVKAHLDHCCSACGTLFDEELHEARMAPGVSLVVAETEKPYAVVDKAGKVICPHCGHSENSLGLGKGQKWKNKKVELSLLVHPQWLAGSPGFASDGSPYGGSATDTPEATAAWNQERASKIKLLEVRGVLPEEVICPETGMVIKTDKGTIPLKITKSGQETTEGGKFVCQSSTCGQKRVLVEDVAATHKTAPVAVYAYQGYCPECSEKGYPYNGRFFAPFSDSESLNQAELEWFERKDNDLTDFYPKSEIPFGHMTHQRQPLPQHGYTHWWKMFNSRQLLGHSLLLNFVNQNKNYSQLSKECVLGTFQQYLRNQCMFSFWHTTYDKLAPALSNSNFHPKPNIVEVGVFSPMGYGPWSSTIEIIFRSYSWLKTPWEVISKTLVPNEFKNDISGKSEKIVCYDSINSIRTNIVNSSATSISDLTKESYDLLITDPPFGGLLHYAELSDFFYVWLRLVLKDQYPDYFSAEYTPKALECISSRARHEDPDAFYQRLLTQCWKESYRILKDGGILAFTFHHNEDEPWVNVLESLFDAGFYLIATYPIRSDETKGEGEFGSKKLEYDIIHVCRKRTEDPTPISWGKMRREVLQAVRQLQEILELHQKSGLPAADLQMIKRGKALEYYSRHYGQVYVDEGVTLSVKEALLGINQLLNEDNPTGELPPVNAEPSTRQFLRIFQDTAELPRNQMQNYLRGTGYSPKEFQERGWCYEKSKIYYLTDPLQFAQNWKGKARQKLSGDYDQAIFLIGASIENSGINVNDTLKNTNFRPHPALNDLLDWFTRHGATTTIQQAAKRALQLLRAWEQQQQPERKPQQLSIFGED